jgi:hypothetical protein
VTPSKRIGIQEEQRLKGRNSSAHTSSILLERVFFLLLISDSSLFSLWMWTHSSNAPGSFMAFSLWLGLHHWSFLFWVFQLLGLSCYWFPQLFQSADGQASWSNKSPLIIVHNFYLFCSSSKH